MNWLKEKMNNYKTFVEKLPNIGCFAISSTFWVDFVTQKKGLRDCLKELALRLRGPLKLSHCYCESKMKSCSKLVPSPIPIYLFKTHPIFNGYHASCMFWLASTQKNGTTPSWT